MLVDVEIRDRLFYYCTITKQTQEKAASRRCARCWTALSENDPLIKAKLDRVKALKEELANL
jgi:hypothetical protein